MEKNKYKQNDEVHFKLSDYVEGYGKVVGVANNGQPLIGKTYIIEPIDNVHPNNFPNEVYPYTHIVVPELFLTPKEDYM